MRFYLPFKRFLILFVCTFFLFFNFVGYASAISIFEDGFETGNTNNWTSSLIESGNTLGVTTSAKQSGVYGMHVTTLATNDDANVRKQFTPQTDLYMRSYVRLNQNIGSGYHKMLFVASSASDGSPYTGALALRTNGTPANRIYSYAANAYRDTGVSLSTSQWSCMEMHVVVSTTNGRIQLWKDDVLLQDVSGLNTGSTAVSWARLGSDSNPSTSDMDFDDLVIDTARIGCTDTTPPVLSNGTPSGTLPSGTTSATLSVTTNENATCKYDIASGTPYSVMPNTFSTTGGTFHSTLVSGLSDGNTYNYNVKCQDTLGNPNTSDFPISFSVANPDTVPPTASISINQGSVATTSALVNLSLTCTDASGVQDVRYSNDGVFDTETFESFSSSKAWTLPGGDGDKTVWYQCRDASSNQNVVTVSDAITLDTVSPLTSLVSVGGDTTSPYEDTVDDNSTVIVVDGEVNMTCRWYDTDIAYSSSSGTLGTTTGTQSTLTVTPSTSGSQTKYVSCVDSVGNGQSNTQNLDITWTGVFPDTTPPVLSNGTPTGSLPSGTTQATLSLTSNENATCKYSTTSGTPYSSMTNTFTTTGTTSHSTQVTGLSDGNTYNYYVRCQDISGNPNTSDYAISFSVANPPGPIDLTKLRPIKILTYKETDTQNYRFFFEALFQEWYNIEITYIDPAIDLTTAYLAPFDVVLHPELNDLNSSEEAALIAWALEPNHSLIGAHWGVGSISQNLANQVFGINVGGSISGTIDRSTIDESYDIGTILKYSVVGTQGSSKRQITNISASVIARLNTGDPCFTVKNNDYYSCAQNLKDIDHYSGPAQPLILSALTNLDIVMPKIKFMTIHDDSHNWYSTFVSGTSQRIIDAAAGILNGHGSRDVHGFIADRFINLPSGVQWFKDNEGKHDIVSHSYAHNDFNIMTPQQQDQDFDLFEQKMTEYGLPYENFFASPSHSGDVTITPGIAAAHGFRYERTSKNYTVPDIMYTFIDGVYFPGYSEFKYLSPVESILNENLLATYHGWYGLNTYSHYFDFDSPAKLSMMDQALGIINSLKWGELAGAKEYAQLHRLDTSKFYRDGSIMYAEITGEFLEGGYVELLAPNANATWCKIVSSNRYLLKCSGDEIYVPIPSNASSPVYVEVHNDVASPTIAKLVSAENGIFFEKAEYDFLSQVAEFYAFGFGKNMQFYYPENTFSGLDNGVEFARVENDALTSSDPLYVVTYDSATNILTFQVPTLMTEPNYRTLRFSPTSDTPPVRSNGAPTGSLPSGTTSATLSLTTNENATCKYSTVAGTAYSSMINVFTVSGGTSHSSQVGGLSDGNTYNYYVRCQDTVGNANGNDYLISFSVSNPVDTTPPITSLLSVSGDTTSPYEDTVDDNSTVIVVDGETGMTCRWYDTDVAYSSSSGTLGTTTGTQSTLTVTPSTSGSQTKYVSCVDSVGNGQSSTQNLDVTWTGNFPDTTPPVLSNGAPTGSLPSGTTQATLSLTSNENATCKYSTTSGVAYSSMTNTFTTTGTTSHSTQVTGLSDGNTYNYYVRCQDTNNNPNISDYNISFVVVSASLFSDWFESGNTNNWTSQLVEAGNTLGVTAQAAYSGIYGLHITTGTSNDDANVRKQISSQSDLYLRTYIRLNQNIGTGNHKHFIVTSSASDGSPFLGSLALRTNGSPINRLYTYAAGAYRDLGVSLTTGQWTCMEMHIVISSSNGRIQAWKDDVLLQDVSGLNTGTAPITWLRLGADSNASFGDFDLDGFVVNTSRVGC